MLRVLAGNTLFCWGITAALTANNFSPPSPFSPFPSPFLDFQPSPARGRSHLTDPLPSDHQPDLSASRESRPVSGAPFSFESPERAESINYSLIAITRTPPQKLRARRFVRPSSPGGAFLPRPRRPAGVNLARKSETFSYPPLLLHGALLVREFHRSSISSAWCDSFSRFSLASYQAVYLALLGPGTFLFNFALSFTWGNFGPQPAHHIVQAGVKCASSLSEPVVSAVS